MNNFKFVLILITILFFSCNEKKEKGKVVLSGKMNNLEIKNIILSGGGNNKIIELDKNHSFTDTINIEEGEFNVSYAGYYSFPIYLEPNKNIFFNLDYNKGTQLLTFSNEGGQINTFLTEKCALINDDNSETFFKLTEEEFIIALNKRKKDVANLIASSEYSDLFKKTQAKNLDFDYINQVKNFPANNCYYIGKSYREVSENIESYYPKTQKIIFEFINTVGLDNEEHFNTSYIYKGLVNTLFYSKIMDKIGGFDNYKDFNDAAIKEVSTYKTPSIKDFIVSAHLVNKLTSNNPNYKKVYKGIHKLVTNNKLRESIEEKYQIIEKLAPGSIAPNFSYEDINGEIVSLSDFRGKYVYIDIWGTWCAPCREEIPYLKKIEKNFHNKNLEFISISVNDKKEGWKKFVKEEELKGIQLFEDREASKFNISELYQIPGYPTFILLDEEGKIISVDAMRPSNPKIEEYLNSYIQ